MGRKSKHAPASRKRSSSSRPGTRATADPPPPSPQPTPARRIINSFGLVALGAVVTGLGVMLANPPGGDPNAATTLTSASAAAPAPAEAIAADSFATLAALPPDDLAEEQRHKQTIPGGAGPRVPGIPGAPGGTP